MADMSVSVEGFEQTRFKLLAMVGPGFGRGLNRHIGERLVERLKDHLDTMSVSRHKTADRLGAKHTRHFEFASGRAGGENGQATEFCDVTNTSVTLAVRNTPGLRRAYGPMTIRPVRARALTIPIHKDAYGKTVKDLKNEGRTIFRIQGGAGAKPVLAESDPNAKNGIRPLYVLVQKVTVPQDTGLLPRPDEIRAWAGKAVKGYVRSMGIG